MMWRNIEQRIINYVHLHFLLHSHCGCSNFWTLRTTNYPRHQKQIGRTLTYNWQWCCVSMIYRWRIHVPPCLNNTLWSLSIRLTILAIFKFESCGFAPFAGTATPPWVAPHTLSPWCSQESWLT
jgi:hypothetical protein